MASGDARLNIFNIIQQRRRTSRRKVFRKYRFMPDTILFIISMFFEYLVHPTLRNPPLPPMLQALAALRFVATGSFYNLFEESLGVTKSTTGRLVRHLAGNAGNYTKFLRDV